MNFFNVMVNEIFRSIIQLPHLTDPPRYRLVSEIETIGPNLAYFPAELQSAHASKFPF